MNMQILLMIWNLCNGYMDPVLINKCEDFMVPCVVEYVDVLEPVEAYDLCEESWKDERN